ncbi:hypothetical protein D3C80_1359590 [compost metagenome]
MHQVINDRRVIEFNPVYRFGHGVDNGHAAFRITGQLTRLCFIRSQDIPAVCRIFNHVRLNPGFEGFQQLAVIIEHKHLAVLHGIGFLHRYSNPLGCRINVHTGQITVNEAACLGQCFNVDACLFFRMSAIFEVNNIYSRRLRRPVNQIKLTVITVVSDNLGYTAVFIRRTYRIASDFGNAD